MHSDGIFITKVRARSIEPSARPYKDLLGGEGRAQKCWDLHSRLRRFCHPQRRWVWTCWKCSVLCPGSHSWFVFLWPNESCSPHWIDIPWTSAIDCFSTRCILADLYLVQQLFHYTETDIEHIALLDHVLGPFPVHFACRVEHLQPGTFVFDEIVKVSFLCGDVHHQDEVRQVMTASPLSVSVACVVLSIGTDQDSSRHSFTTQSTLTFAGNSCISIPPVGMTSWGCSSTHSLHPSMMTFFSLMQ